MTIYTDSAVGCNVSGDDCGESWGHGNGKTSNEY